MMSSLLKSKGDDQKTKSIKKDCAERETEIDV
jgi:hypothetical protein